MHLNLTILSNEVLESCLFFLSRLEDATNCSLTSQLLLDVLRGPNYPQFVASFGNSPLERQLDWVSIKRTFNPQDSPSCGIPLSLHLEIEWTKYGTLVNPQAQIVSINEIIQTNSSQLALLSGGSSIIPIRTSVSFISVSAPATPGYRAMPTIDAKLPFDFFFPFAWSENHSRFIYLGMFYGSYCKYVDNVKA